MLLNRKIICYDTGRDYGDQAIGLGEGGQMIHEGKNKRKYQRFHVHCPISFICFNKLRIGETENLSLGGMKIQSRYLLFKGEIYDFTVVMHGRAINPRGKVVYLENQREFTYSAGVSFVHLSEDHQNQLNAFLSAPNQDEPTKRS
jgi:c-di-GMP-binding flagellar brake protein YcgR